MKNIPRPNKGNPTRFLPGLSSRLRKKYTNDVMAYAVLLLFRQMSKMILFQHFNSLVLPFSYLYSIGKGSASLCVGMSSKSSKTVCQHKLKC